MLDQTGFDLWANGYDKTVGISDEENSYPFAGYKKILGLIIDRKIALEINTSCMYEGFGYRELMPEARIIKMYADMGGYLITTGSDAHNAENSALYFNELYGRLKKEFGFRNIYYYKNRFAAQCGLTEE